MNKTMSNLLITFLLYSTYAYCMDWSSINHDTKEEQRDTFSPEIPLAEIQAFDSVIIKSLAAAAESQNVDLVNHLFKNPIFLDQKNRNLVITEVKKSSILNPVQKELVDKLVKEEMSLVPR